jgi:lipid-binding SYLF domain-containing protein
MKISSALRAALLALIAFAGATLSSAARADEGFVTLTIYKAGWIIGGSGGGGTLTFHGRTYPLSAGIYRPSDVAGVYGAAGAGLAVGGGARAIVLSNQKGAVLELSGRQVGLMANVDLSGLAITMR